MAAPVITVKKLPMSVTRKRSAYKPLISPSTAQKNYTLAKIAQDKGFQLSDIGDFAKEVGQVGVTAALDTIALPQREVTALLDEGKLINPYAKDASKYDPAHVLDMQGLDAFMADTVLDPLIVGGGLKAIGGTAFKAAGKKLLTLGPKAIREGQKLGEAQAAEAALAAEKATSPEVKLADLTAERDATKSEIADLTKQREQRAEIFNQELQAQRDANAAIGRQGKGQRIDGTNIAPEEVAKAQINDANYVPDGVSPDYGSSLDTSLNLVDKELLRLDHEEAYAKKRARRDKADAPEVVKPVSDALDSTAADLSRSEENTARALRDTVVDSVTAKRVKGADGKYETAVQPGKVKVSRGDIDRAYKKLEAKPLGLAEPMRIGGTGEFTFDTTGVQKVLQDGFLKMQLDDAVRQRNAADQVMKDSSAGKAAQREADQARSEADRLGQSAQADAEKAGRQFGRTQLQDEQKERSLFKKLRSWNRWNDEYIRQDASVRDINQKIIIAERNLKRAIDGQDARLAGEAKKQLDELVAVAEETHTAAKAFADAPMSFGKIRSAGRQRKATQAVNDLVDGGIKDLRSTLDRLYKEQTVRRGMRREAGQGRTTVEKTVGDRIEAANRLYPRGKDDVVRGNEPNPGKWKGNSIDEIKDSLTLDAKNKVDAAQRTYDEAKAAWDEAITAVNRAEKSGNAEELAKADAVLGKAQNDMYAADELLGRNERAFEEALQQAGRINSPMSAEEKLAGRKIRGSMKRSYDALQKREAQRAYSSRKAAEARKDARDLSRRASSVRTQERIQQLKASRIRAELDKQIDKLVKESAALQGITPETKIGGRLTRSQRANIKKRAAKNSQKLFDKGVNAGRILSSIRSQRETLLAQRDAIIREIKALQGKPVVPMEPVSRRTATKTWFKEGKKLEDTLAKLQSNLDDIEGALRQAATPQGELALSRAEGIASLIGGELAPDNLALILGWRIPFQSGKMVPLVAIQNERLAALMQSLGKVPLVGRLGKAVNEAFNPAANSDRRLYEAKRIASHAAVEMTEEEITHILKFWENVTAADRPKLIELGRVEHDVLDLDVLKPETWGDVVKQYRREATDARTRLDKELQQGSITYKQYEKGLMGAAADEEMAKRAEEGIKIWSQLSEAARTAHLQTHTVYQRKGRELVALGVMKPSQLRENYQYSRSLNRDDVRARNRSSAPPVTEKDFMKAKKQKGLPDDFDELENLIAFVRDSNSVITNRKFVEQVAFKFGVTRKASEALAKETGDRFVKLKTASKVFDYPVYIPEHIEKAMNNLVNIGTDPAAGSEMLRVLQDLTSKWKSAAYTVNFGHLLADSTGDIYNTMLQMGPGNFARYSGRVLTQNHPLSKVELYLKSVAEGKSFEDIVDVNGKQMTLRELAATELAFGKRKNVKMSVRRFATNLQSRGLRNTGAAVGDVGKSPKTFKGALRNTVNIGGASVPLPRPIMALSSKAQNIGNWRDNFFKHRMAFAMHLEKRADEGLGSREAMRQAAKDVRQSLFDYSELTQFEKRIARNFIPFYTWTRKNVPYQVRMLFERPVATTAPFKLQQDLRDPNEPDYLTPDYVRERFLRIGDLPGPLAKIVGQKKGQPFYLNPMLPGYDLGFLQKTTGGIDTAEPLGMLTPYVRLPIELAQEKPTNFQTGAPIEGEYFGNNKGVPFLGAKGEYVLQNLLGQPGRQLVRGVDTSRSQSERVLPLFGAQLGLRGTVVNPALQKEYALRRVQDKRREELRLLQDAGLLPMGDKLAAGKRSRKLAGLNASITPKY